MLLISIIFINQGHMNEALYNKQGPPLQYDENIDLQDNVETINDGLTAHARSAFVVKVYLLLTFELTITFGLCLLSQFYQPYRVFQLNNIWALVCSVCLMLLSMLLAFCVSKSRNYPYSVLLLLAFILSFSYLLSFACSAVLQEVPGPTIITALAITIEIVVALTLYALFCKVDFNVLFGILITVSITMFFTFIVIIFDFSPMLISVYSGLCAIVYGVYLVILTKMVIENKVSSFPLDSAIIASIFLYIYIIRIFLMILRIVANSKRRK